MYATDRKIRREGRLLASLMVTLLLWLVAGCGGGGGSNGGNGGGGNAGLRGQILLVSTSSAPPNNTFLEIGGTSQQVTSLDGRFTLTALPATATTLTIRNADSNNVEQFRRTLTVALISNQTVDLGPIYVGDQGYTANVVGRIVTNVGGTNQPVGNARVTLSGERVVTGANGTFRINGLPVGLGSLPGALLGDIVATGFETKPLLSETLGPPLSANDNNVGDIVIATPVGSTPLPPHTVTGSITVQGVAQAGVLVTLKVGATTLGTTTTDASGAYFFWVVPASYTVVASKSGFTNKQVNVTLQKLDTPVTAPAMNLTP